MNMSNMMMNVVASEQIRSVRCNFCTNVLAVSVPCKNLMDIVTVRCGHCSNVWSVNMAAADAFHYSLSNAQHIPYQASNIASLDNRVDLGSSSRFALRPQSMTSHVINHKPSAANRPPEKRRRIPSAYNQFIKEEIQRIKVNNPDITHREAFSTAAKNWAHFPRIHFGLLLENNHHQPN